MKKHLLFVFAALFSLCSSAQVINGDLDGDNDVTVNDAVLLLNDYVTNNRHYVNGVGGESFAQENFRIVGTWWKSQSSKISFNADGTTDIGTGYTYKYLPALNLIVFNNAEGTLTATLEVVRLTDTTLELRNPGTIDTSVYSKNHAVKLVTGVTLSSTSLTMSVNDESRLTATVTPSDADNKTVIWKSGNEQIAIVNNGFVTAIASGRTTITATAQDGSGVKATCVVNVSGGSNVTKPTTHNGYAYVDLGTGVKWATMNVGASAAEDYGDYFAWGETTGYKSGKTVFNESTYKWYSDSRKMTKYCSDRTLWDTSLGSSPDYKTVLDLTDDAANVNWGGNWRMPTRAEQDALLSQCYWQWVTTYKGRSVNGYIVYKAKADADKGKYKASYVPSGSYSISDPHIFLPAAGVRSGSELSNAGSYGRYWSSSLYESIPYDAYYLYFYSGYLDKSYSSRVEGRSVRAVCP